MENINLRTDVNVLKLHVKLTKKYYSSSHSRKEFTQILFLSFSVLSDESKSVIYFKVTKEASKIR